MISVEEAQARIAALTPVMGVEEVPLIGAQGRVLAEPVVAARNQPPFRSSAMDGYAVRSEDAQPGAALRVIGESAAGARYSGSVDAGEAVRIFTGAPVPEGADAVLIQENATHEAGVMTPSESAKAGDNIRPEGIDFNNHDTLLEAPRKLTPEDVALAAAANRATLVVRRRPVVALLATGDELVYPGETPGPDQIISSNSYGLYALLSAAGAAPRLLPIARDDAASLRGSVEKAQGADLLVTLGGASVGDHDIVAMVLESVGLTIDFHKVSMRPGKPMMAGKIDGMAMIGLPGNPVSAMVCGRVFLTPAIERMLGLPRAAAENSTARLTCDLGPNGPRQHYMRATLSGTAVDLRCTPCESQDSSRLRILAVADALAVRPPNDPPRKAGDRIDILRLRKHD